MRSPGGAGVHGPLRRTLGHIAALIVLLAAACAPRAELILASTTSTFDSGLLDVLLPAFEKEHAGIRVKLVAVGSGEAMALGRRGDADVLLVHAPEDEAAFMDTGHGRARHAVMWNDYVIVGPPDDPAGVAGAGSAADAMLRIRRAGTSFISRGDSSGTHRRELRLWRDAGVAAPVRVEIGQGMGEALAIASERGAYTLSDRGTFLALAGTLRLAVLFSGDASLANPYSVITVSGSRREREADIFARWLLSEGARALIAQHRAGGTGAALFTPGSPPD